MKLDYQVVYSRRKSLSLTVERDASVVVRAPEGTSEDLVRRAVEARKLWLFQKVSHKQKYQTRPQRKEFVSGETILYLGRNYRLEVTSEDLERIEFHSRFVISRKNQGRAADLFREWYQRRAEHRIPQRAGYFADAMGVTFNRIRICNLAVRWGSCTPKNNLNFSWRLLKAPIAVIDYVIVHELAHLLEPNHTPHFWSIVAVQVPRSEWAREWLRDHGEVLEVEF